MNTYHIVFWVSNTSNIETNVHHEFNLEKFTDWFNELVQNKEAQFINLVGDDKKIMINKNNVIFYTIELKNSN